MAPTASHDHSRKKERTISVLGLVLKPLYVFFPDLIRVGLKLQKPNVTWGVQRLYVSALSFLIHSKMELNSMKNHFKIDRNCYCFLGLER